MTDYIDPVDIAVRQTATLQSYIAERSGEIFELATDGVKGQQVLDISDLTVAQGEQGLLGLAFAPDGSSAYVNYTNLAGDTVIASFTINTDGTFDESSQSIITTIKQPYPNHNGGEIIVDQDGSLFVFMGDGGSADDPERYALDITSPLGKIWKLTQTAGQWNTGESWAVGLRNPWRASLDPVTNDLWVADVGQDNWEEINVVPFDQVQGVSFGWSAREGTHEFNADQQALHETFTAVEPVYEYEHVDNNCSISGGVVYRGSQVPVSGTWYIFSDYCTGKVEALCIDEQRQNCGVIDLGTVEKSVGVVADAQGEVWVLSQNGLIVPIIAD
jgi:glucose/arabinose dehydrogenase